MVTSLTQREIDTVFSKEHTKKVDHLFSFVNDDVIPLNGETTEEEEYDNYRCAG